MEELSCVTNSMQQLFLSSLYFIVFFPFHGSDVTWSEHRPMLYSSILLCHSILEFSLSFGHYGMMLDESKPWKTILRECNTKQKEKPSVVFNCHQLRKLD